MNIKAKKIGKKSKRFKCPYCKRALRYRGRDENGKEIYSCKRPYRYVNTSSEPRTLIDVAMKRKDDSIKVGYCNYEIRI